MSETRVERGAVASFGVLARGTNGTFRGPREHLALQTRLTVALGVGQEYLLGRRKVDNGSSGSNPPSLTINGLTVLLVVAAEPQVKKKVTRCFHEVSAMPSGSHNCRPVKKSWYAAFSSRGERSDRITCR